MRNKTNRRQQRGFSLLEVAVVLGIIAVVVAVAIPMFSKSRSSSELRSTANQLVGDFRRAQGLARSGKADVAGWGVGVRTRQAGIRFISNTQYAIFVDQDTQQNGAASEADMEVVDIAANGEPLQFVSPPAQIRFRKNGTLPTPPDLQVTLRNTDTNQTKVVQVTYGGRASVL